MLGPLLRPLLFNFATLILLIFGNSRSLRCLQPFHFAIMLMSLRKIHRVLFGLRGAQVVTEELTKGFEIGLTHGGFKLHFRYVADLLISVSLTICPSWCNLSTLFVYLISDRPVGKLHITLYNLWGLVFVFQRYLNFSCNLGENLTDKPFFTLSFESGILSVNGSHRTFGLLELLLVSLTLALDLKLLHTLVLV